MKFGKFFKLHESTDNLPKGYVLKSYSEDDSDEYEDYFGRDMYDVAQDADDLMKKVDIRPSRNQNLSIIAFDLNGKVVGALYDEVENRERDEFVGSDDGEVLDGGNNDRLRAYDFALAVCPDERGRKIGYALALEVVKRARELECDLCYVWVVNPKMARILEHLGFEFWQENEQTDGRYSATMIKWM